MSEWKGLTIGFEPELGKDYGFIYHIRNVVTGQRYIGSKQFFSHVKETKKSSPKFGKKVYKESNWRKYQSSNDKFKEMDPNDLVKTVIKIVDSKFMLTYEECRILIESKALLDDNYENYMLSSFLLGRAPAKNRFNSLEEKYKEV